ncbi:MAG: 4-carboxy-4-hydroxy-2-oxoadipate aldolase/oxaloacetate decarboxylase [Clostridia bacterium]
MGGYTIYTAIPRRDDDAGRADRMRRMGVATMAEAQDKRGLLDPVVRPIQHGGSVAGPAVTVLMPAGDNLMLHAAIEHLHPGDVLVVTTLAPSVHGVFGELLAEACHYRSVAGVVLDTGVRDTAPIRALGLRVWARAVYAGGALKGEAGYVNVPVTAAGVRVSPGDFVVADDDGVVVVPRTDADAVLSRAEERAAREEETRRRIRGGEISLDLSNLRPVLQSLGVRYENGPYRPPEH